LRIQDIRGERSRIDLEAEVVGKTEPREVNLRGGGTILAATAIIKDDSGCIDLTLWGDEINKINVGDRIRIENGYTRAFRGMVNLNVGRYRLLEVVR